MYICTNELEWKVYPDPANYELVHEGMTWQEAEDYCESFGGHLAVITSQREQAILQIFRQMDLMRRISNP